jgi:sporulation protein YlmC with PRC-barrel domain
MPKNIHIIAAAVLLLCFNTAWADCQQELAKLNTAYPDIRPVPSDLRWLWETKHTAMKLNDRNETTLCHKLIVDMQRHLAKMKALSNLRPSFHYDQDARKPVTNIAHLFRADDIIGSPVINADNNTMGIIEAVTFESESGRIHYVVMDAGGVLDPEPRPVAIPWNKLSWIQSDQVFVVDASRKSMQYAPAIGSTDWPGSVDASWIDGAYDVADDRKRPAD